MKAFATFSHAAFGHWATTPSPRSLSFASTYSAASACTPISPKTPTIFSAGTSSVCLRLTS